MYDAGRQLGTGFTLFMSADLCCNTSDADMRDMVTPFAEHPNQFTYAGRIVFSAVLEADKGRDWWHDRVLQPLQQAGTPSSFLPNFTPRLPRRPQ